MLASAPDFSPIPLSPPGCTCYDDFFNGINTIWNLDGNSFLWSGLGLESEFNYTDIIILDRSGEERRIVTAGGARSSLFLGWMDSISLLATSYAGGGNTGGTIINTVTGEQEGFGDSFTGFYAPNRDYIPINDSLGFNQPTFDKVISRALLNPEDPEVYLHKKFLLNIPTNHNFSDPAGLRIVNWYPDRIKMLILVWRNGMDLTNDLEIETTLQLWDTQTNTTEVIVIGGVAGEFSPDGSKLAFVTNHELLLDDNHKIVTETDQINREKLYIMDIASQEILYIIGSDSNIISPGASDLESGWSGGNLNSFAWAPNSESFVHRNPNGNLEIVYLSDERKLPITIGYGIHVIIPEWSFDGTYLSVSYTLPKEGESFPSQYVTAILVVP